MASPARQYPNNLPIALSSFIGRGREIVEVKRLFTTARLLTLIGAGGCGKTRLAIWVATELGVPLNLSGLGEMAVRQGQYERATRLLEESLLLRRQIRGKWGIGTSLGSLGWIALQQRDFKRMRTLLSESLTVRMEISSRRASPIARLPKQWS